MALSRLTNWILSFTDIAQSGAIVICSHLLAAKSHQFYLCGIFTGCPFPCNPRTPPPAGLQYFSLPSILYAGPV